MSTASTLVTGQSTPAGTRTRVLVCDDSLVIRGAIGRMLRAQADFDIVASVRDGQAAIDAVRTWHRTASIDVVVLDIEMPVMDGMAALPVLLDIDPTVRVIMASTLTLRGASIAIEALGLGAADYVPKPSTTGAFGDEDFRTELVAKVRGLGRLRRLEQGGRANRSRIDGPAITTRSPRLGPKAALLAISSSTGGPQALFSLFGALGPKLGVPVVLTQHMPASFVPLLADQIAKLGGMTCREASQGETLQADHVTIAPGGRHLTVQPGARGLTVALSDAPAENFCRPSVDVMLRSAAVACGSRTLVVMLTGMGRDGLLGTRAVVEAGGTALAQDEDSSVVWGRPGAIANAGLCRSVLPLKQIPAAIRALVGA